MYPTSPKKLLLSLCLSVTGLLCYSGLAKADDDTSIRGPYLGFSFGSASPDADHFDGARVDTYHAGYYFPYLSAEFNYTPFERFQHEQADATDIHVWSAGITAIPRYEFNRWLSVEVLLGVQRWEAKARFLGVHFGSDDGTSSVLGMGGRLQFMNGWAGTLRWQQFNDVSGTDISHIALGVHYVFQ